MNNSLNEGLVRNDLNDLILPMLDIDTFESKIDNAKVIVVAFYIFDREPANDLKVFIERGGIYTLDVEVSPAPTVDGYFVVFVELDRGPNFPEEVVEMVKSIDNLTNVDKWQFKTIGSDDIFELTKESLKEHVELNPAEVPPSTDDIEDELDDLRDEDIEKDEDENEDKDEDEEELAEVAVPFLRDGLMESIEADDDLITLMTTGGSLRYQVVYASSEQPSAPMLYPQIGDSVISESMRLSAILGNSYSVDIVNDGLLVNGDKGYIILKPID